MQINRKDAWHYGIGKDWSILEFTYHNPTDSDFSFNLFYNNNLFNYPDTPFSSNILYPVNLFYKSIASNAYTGIAFSITNDRLYLSNGGTVDILNTLTNVVDQTIITPFSISKMAYSTVDNKIFAIGSASNQYLVIDCNTNTIVSTSVLSSVGLLQDIIYNSSKNTFYITQAFGSNTLYEVSSATNLQIFSVALAGGSVPQWLAFDSTKNSVYVCLNGASLILDFSCVTNTSITTIPTISPVSSIEYNPIKNTVYNTQGGTILREIDATSETYFGTAVALPKGVVDLLFNYAGNVLYVTQFDGTVVNSAFIVDCTTNVIVNTYPLASAGANVGSLVFDPNADKVYSSWNGGSSYLEWRANLQFYITGSDDYNQAISDTVQNPAIIRRMDFITRNNINLKQVLNAVDKDANGNVTNEPIIPNIKIGQYQFQGTMAEMDFVERPLIIGQGRYFQNFTVKAHSEIKTVIWYQQADKSTMLTHGRQSLAIREGIDGNSPVYWNEKDLEQYKFNEIVTPFI